MSSVMRDARLFTVTGLFVCTIWLSVANAACDWYQAVTCLVWQFVTSCWVADQSEQTSHSHYRIRYLCGKFTATT